ncbi:MAG: hypothetical protein AAGM38_19015 [Pseudomonadota bacterium]
MSVAARVLRAAYELSSPRCGGEAFAVGAWGAGLGGEEIGPVARRKEIERKQRLAEAQLGGDGGRAVSGERRGGCADALKRRGGA